MVDCGTMQTPSAKDSETPRKAWQTPVLDALSVLDTEISGGTGSDFGAQS